MNDKTSQSIGQEVQRMQSKLARLGHVASVRRSENLVKSLELRPVIVQLMTTLSIGKGPSQSDPVTCVVTKLVCRSDQTYGIQPKVPLPATLPPVAVFSCVFAD